MRLGLRSQGSSCVPEVHDQLSRVSLITCAQVAVRKEVPRPMAGIAHQQIVLGLESRELLVRDCIFNLPRNHHLEERCQGSSTTST